MLSRSEVENWKNSDHREDIFTRRHSDDPENEKYIVERIGFAQNTVFHGIDSFAAITSHICFKDICEKDVESNFRIKKIMSSDIGRKNLGAPIEIYVNLKMFVYQIG